jgi:hypothetical protein
MVDVFPLVDAYVHPSSLFNMPAPPHRLSQTVQEQSLISVRHTIQ